MAQQPCRRLLRVEVWLFSRRGKSFSCAAPVARPCSNYNICKGKLDVECKLQNFLHGVCLEK